MAGGEGGDGEGGAVDGSASIRRVFERTRRRRACAMHSQALSSSFALILSESINYACCSDRPRRRGGEGVQFSSRRVRTMRARSASRARMSVKRPFQNEHTLARTLVGANSIPAIVFSGMERKWRRRREGGRASRSSWLLPLKGSHSWPLTEEGTPHCMRKGAVKSLSSSSRERESVLREK